jgi:hypothetical protein
MGFCCAALMALLPIRAMGGVAISEGRVVNLSPSLPWLAPPPAAAADPFPALLATPASAILQSALPSAHPEQQDAIAAPEPTSLSLLAAGLGIIAVARRHRRWFR